MFTYFINRGSKESKQDTIIEIFVVDIPLIAYIVYLVLQ